LCCSEQINDDDDDDKDEYRERKDKELHFHQFPADKKVQETHQQMR